MKMVYFGLILAFLIPTTTFSQGKSELKEAPKEETQNRRRKKVMMCHECGKPETECDCEGEGHGVHEEDKNENDEKGSSH